MVRHHKVFIKTKTTQILVALAIVLLILLAVFFIYKYFLKPNTYLIENKYYGFKLQTPRDWIAEEKTIYSEDNITNLLAQCKNNKATNEIGVFRFESQKYNQDSIDSGKFPAKTLSGIILELTVSCVSDDIILKDGRYTGDFKIGGENTFVYHLTDKVGGRFDPEIRISFYHNNFKYIVDEYIYISSQDRSTEQNLRKDYESEINKILSSFNFIQVK